VAAGPNFKGEFVAATRKSSSNLRHVSYAARILAPLTRVSDDKYSALGAPIVSMDLMRAEMVDDCLTPIDWD
jgi:hypothetical protein